VEAREKDYRKGRARRKSRDFVNEEREVFAGARCVRALSLAGERSGNTEVGHFQTESVL
jgi:hypothetical protein